MASKRKAAGQPKGAGRRRKTPKTAPFVWKPRNWELKKPLTNEVSILQSKITAGILVVKKLMPLKANPDEDPEPQEMRMLAALPDCNRVVKPIFASNSSPIPGYGLAIYEHYPLGDLWDWKTTQYDQKRYKAVPESIIWRFFIQMSQALAFIHNEPGVGPRTQNRRTIIHRDIKPTNVLVVSNGSTYPSFKLHDFDCATVYTQEKARQETVCGTFEWQPPENPIINTKAADIWSLGACVYWLATGWEPTRDIPQYMISRWTERQQHRSSAMNYPSPSSYYHARTPRDFRPINMTTAEHDIRSRASRSGARRPKCDHQYGDILNIWMEGYLTHNPSHRTTTEDLTRYMTLDAGFLLQLMGGKAALTDLDIKFGS